MSETVLVAGKPPRTSASGEFWYDPGIQSTSVKNEKTAGARTRARKFRQEHSQSRGGLSIDDVEEYDFARRRVQKDLAHRKHHQTPQSLTAIALPKDRRRPTRRSCRKRWRQSSVSGFELRIGAGARDLKDSLGLCSFSPLESVAMGTKPKSSRQRTGRKSPGPGVQAKRTKDRKNVLTRFR
jgi:hypothetical protein